MIIIWPVPPLNLVEELSTAPPPDVMYVMWDAKLGPRVNVPGTETFETNITTVLVINGPVNELVIVMLLPCILHEADLA